MKIYYVFHVFHAIQTSTIDELYLMINVIMIGGLEPDISSGLSLHSFNEYYRVPEQCLLESNVIYVN